MEKDDAARRCDVPGGVRDSPRLRTAAGGERGGVGIASRLAHELAVTVSIVSRRVITVHPDVNSSLCMSAPVSLTCLDVFVVYEYLYPVY